MTHTRLIAVLGLLALLMASGCATVNTRHPAVADKPGPDVASVYFIRPAPVISHAFGDAAVTIEYQGQKLLKLSERTYTLLYLKPSKGEVKIYNNTYFTNRPESQRVWKERMYRFVAGRTYFIHVKQVNEEFRGLFYEPELVNLAQAKRLARHLYRIGSAASDHPIAKLTEADIVPPPASAAKDTEPTLPENLYRPESYMKKPK